MVYSPYFIVKPPMFDGPLSISIRGLMAKVHHIHPYSTIIFLSRLVSHMFPCKHLGAQSPPIHCRFWWKCPTSIRAPRISDPAWRFKRRASAMASRPWPPRWVTSQQLQPGSEGSKGSMPERYLPGHRSDGGNSGHLRSLDVLQYQTLMFFGSEFPGGHWSLFVGNICLPSKFGFNI